MKVKALLRAAMVMLAGGFVVTGCIDENYDLSNVDTTAQLQVKDLVLPINIDEIAMKEFIALEDTGHIQVVNGEYVLIDSGTYSTDDTAVCADFVTDHNAVSHFSNLLLLFLLRSYHKEIHCSDLCRTDCLWEIWIFTREESDVLSRI